MANNRQAPNPRRTYHSDLVFTAWAMPDEGGDTHEARIAGWASTDAVDTRRNRIMPGAFAESIERRGLRGANAIPLLLHHDFRLPAGVIDRLEYRDNKLWMEATVLPEISYVKDALTYIKAMGGVGFSVGYRPEVWRTIRTNGNQISHLEHTKADLLEVSIVLDPANKQATSTFISASDDDRVDIDDPVGLLAASLGDVHLADTLLKRIREDMEAEAKRNAQQRKIAEITAMVEALKGTQ